MKSEGRHKAIKSLWPQSCLCLAKLLSSFCKAKALTELQKERGLEVSLFLRDWRG